MLCICFLTSFSALWPCESDAPIVLYFPFDSYCLDVNYKTNAEAIQCIEDRLHFLPQIDSIVLVSYASPEGVYEHNLWLSEQRVQNIASYFRNAYPQYADKIILKAGGENWEALRYRVLQDTLLSETQRQQVLDILDADVNVGTKKWRLQHLPVYAYLYENYYENLRYSTMCLLYPNALEKLSNRFVSSALLKNTASLEKSVFNDSLCGSAVNVPLLRLQYSHSLFQEPRQRRVYLRSNLLCTLLNVGVELPVAQHWTLAMDYYYPWKFRREDHRNCFQLLAWSAETRYWWSSVNQCLSGSSVGLHLLAGYYDFERNYSGKQGEFVGLGIDYGYALPIFSGRMFLEATLGFAYVFSKARPYNVLAPGGKAYRRGYSEHIHWIGPDKLGLALVLPISWREKR